MVDPCQSGSFSIGRQIACTPCTAGFSCSSTTSEAMSPCPKGYFSLSGADTCTICPAGHYCTSRSSAPVMCPAGSYSSEGSTVCTLAPPGHYVNQPGLSISSICGIGYYSTGGAIDCNLCNPGYHCFPGSTEPSPVNSLCPIGGFCELADTYTPCPPGTYGIVEGGISQSQACAICDPGYLCSSAGTIRATRTVCPEGGE